MIEVLIESAKKEARGLGHNYVGTEHLLLALLDDGEAIKTLAKQGLSVEEVSNELKKIMTKSLGLSTGIIDLTPRLKLSLSLAQKITEANGREKPNSRDILNGLFSEEESIASLVLSRHRYSTIPEPNTPSAFLLQNEFKIYHSHAYKTENPISYVVDLTGKKPRVFYRINSLDLVGHALDARAVFEAHNISYTEHPSLPKVINELSIGLEKTKSLIARIGGLKFL